MLGEPHPLLFADGDSELALANSQKKIRNRSLDSQSSVVYFKALVVPRNPDSGATLS